MHQRKAPTLCCTGSRGHRAPVQREFVRKGSCLADICFHEPGPLGLLFLPQKIFVEEIWIRTKKLISLQKSSSPGLAEPLWLRNKLVLKGAPHRPEPHPPAASLRGRGPGPYGAFWKLMASHSHKGGGHYWLLGNSGWGCRPSSHVHEV